MILQIQQGLREDGYSVPMTKLCRWFEIPRRTVYYRPVKSAPKVQERFAAPIKQLIEEDPSFGYRTVAGLLRFNKNTVQRIFQIKGWQVRKRAVGHRPRIEALPSVATTPNERWATDLCRVWAGRDGWQTLALVIDCHTRELLGWQLSRSGRATTAMSALEQALIARFGTLGRVTTPFLLRSDNGLVFTSRAYTRLVRSYGLRQEFITPHCPQQNGMIERVIRTLKEQCVHRHRFETQQHASRVIGEWIRFYNTRRPHQALGMKTPAMAYALAA
jgi:putative transposase